MKSWQRGFTLIELAIVMLVLTILAAGILLPMTSQIEMRRIQQTTQNLATIQDALIGYAMSHPINIACTCSYDTGQASPYPLLSSSCIPASVPSAQVCPANSPNPTQPTTSVRHYLPCPNYDGTGIEARQGSTAPNPGQCSSSTSLQTPLLPWATLGLSPTDPWGDSYGYDVDTNFSNAQIGVGANNPPDPGTTAPASCPSALTPSYIHIYQTCVSPASLPNSLIAGQLAAVVISFGPNGWGAYNPTNHPPTTGALYTANHQAATVDEDWNSKSGKGSHNYVSHPATDTGTAQGEFDDLLTGLPYSVLLNRVCASGGCP